MGVFIFMPVLLLTLFHLDLLPLCDLSLLHHVHTGKLNYSDTYWFGCQTTTHNVLHHRLHFSKSRTLYYANSSATFQLILSGDIEINPGPSDSPNNNNGSSQKSCNFFIANCRSLVPKLDELREMVLTTNLDILGLCETWLKEEISDQELNIPGYQLFRRDRISEGPRAYGGVAIYIKDNIVCNRRMDLETDCEILWLEFDTNLGKTLFSIFYNPSSQTLVYLDELEKSLQN